jgi:hypothetical protein
VGIPFAPQSGFDTDNEKRQIIRRLPTDFIAARFLLRRGRA